MSSWAVPGAKVVCVDAAPVIYIDGSRAFLLSDRKIYTIQSVQEEFSLCRKTLGVIWGITACLEEVQRNGDVKGFDISRFRPLTKSTKTQEEDIAMFWSILDEEGEKV